MENNDIHNVDINELDNYSNCILSPLLYFDIDETIDFGIFKIIKQRNSTWLKNLLHDSTENMGFVDTEFWHRWPIFLVREDLFTMGKLKNQSFEILLNIFYDAIFLFKNNVKTGFRIGPIWMKINESPTFQYTITGSIHTRSANIRIKYDEIAHMKNFTATFMNLLSETIEDMPEIHRALHWLSKARKSPDHDDKLIYCTTALEILLSDSNSAIKQKLSFRLAILFGKNDMDRKLINKKINILYKNRSNLLHGKIVSDKMHLFAQKIVGILILKFLSLYKNGYDKNKIIDELDKSVFEIKLREIILEKSDNIFPNQTKEVDIHI